jgi:hypothetical protein
MVNGGIALFHSGHVQKLPLSDRAPDEHPHELPVPISLFEHLIGSPRGFEFRVLAEAADQQVGGTPHIDIGDRG